MKQEKKETSGSRGKPKIWRWVLIGVLVIVLGICVKFYIDITNPETLFNQEPVTTPVPEETLKPDSAAKPEAAPTPSPTPDPEAVLLSQADETFMKNRVNVLVLGVDQSVERENWGSFRTDTMILVSIDFETKDVTMISVPRDSYVKICNGSGDPTGKFNRINSAFSAGGGAQKNGYLYAMGTVSHLMGGIPINHYIGFNMNVVKEIVNAMGGVDYDVDVEINMNGRHLDTGMQHMDGQAVLDYCRQRKGDSDIHRVDRQQRMIMTIFDQLKSTGQIVNIPAIYQAVEKNVQTNLSFTQISSLALLALRMDFDQLARYTVEGSNLRVGRASCWGLSMPKLEKLMKNVFGTSVSLDQEMDGTNIKERIKAAQEAISAELAAARSAVATAEGLLTNYDGYLAAEAKSQLKLLKSTLQDVIDEAIDVESKPELDQYTASLNQLNASVQAQLGIYTGQGDGFNSGMPEGGGSLKAPWELEDPADQVLPEIPEIPDLSGQNGLPVG